MKAINLKRSDDFSYANDRRVLERRAAFSLVTPPSAFSTVTMGQAERELLNAQEVLDHSLPDWDITTAMVEHQHRLMMIWHPVTASTLRLTFPL